MGNMRKEKRNVILCCMILAMFGTLNLAVYFAGETPEVYLDDRRLAVKVDRDLQVEVRNFCQQMALDYTLDGGQLVIDREKSQQVIQLNQLLPGAPASTVSPTQVPLQNLCKALNIPYQWDEKQQMVKLGTAFPNALEVPVLMYHHILPAKDIQGIFVNNNIVVSAEEFQQQMNYLKDEGYQTVTLPMLEKYVKGEQLLPEKSVMITFDDGYLSNYTYAYPMLEQAGYQGVIFLLTGFIEEESQNFNPKAVQYLSWAQVEEMDKVFEFGSHTNNMHRLGSDGKGVLYSASYSDLVSDLSASRQKLHHTPYFSYPYGHYSKPALETLRGQGIEVAFTVNEGSVKAGDGLLELKRWDVARYRSLEQFKTILE